MRLRRRKPPQIPPAAAVRPAKADRPTSQAGIADSPLHPFLFAAFSVVAPYAANLRETSLGDIVTPLIVVTAAAALLFAAFGRLVGRYGPRAALLTSILLAGTIFHLDLFSWVHRASRRRGPVHCSPTGDPPIHGRALRDRSYGALQPDGPECDR